VVILPSGSRQMREFLPCLLIEEESDQLFILVKSGPRLLTVVPELPISSLGLQRGETIVSSEPATSADPTPFGGSVSSSIPL